MNRLAVALAPLVLAASAFSALSIASVHRCNISSWSSRICGQNQ